MTITVTRTDKGLEHDVIRALAAVSTTKVRLGAIMPLSKSFHIWFGRDSVFVTPPTQAWENKEFKLTIPI